MSSEAKRVKLLTLFQLIFGLVLIAFGIFLAVTGMQAAVAAVVGGEGLLTLVLGVRGSLIANVPARIGKLATLALVIFLLQAACIACAVYLIGPDHVGENPVLLACTIVAPVVTVVICLLSRGIAKRAER